MSISDLHMIAKC